MKIFIIERNEGIRHELKQIITSKRLGDVAGMFEQWEAAFLSMSRDGVDVVVIGFSQPQKEYLTYIESAKKNFRIYHSS